MNPLLKNGDRCKATQCGLDLGMPSSEGKVTDIDEMGYHISWDDPKVLDCMISISEARFALEKVYPKTSDDVFSTDPGTCQECGSQNFRDLEAMCQECGTPSSLRLDQMRKELDKYPRV